MLQPDTQAILLLCARFGQNQTERQPLTIREYNILADWLREEGMTPKDLLELTFQHRLPQITIKTLESKRLVALLERGVMLSLAIEKWTNQGLWILGRSDTNYPKRLKQKLKHLAPPILYGVGNIKLLSQGGLAIVGSRNVDEEGINYTQNIVQTCAHQGIQVISGGARGVDKVSMLGTLEAGGTVIGVLADSLAKASVASHYRTEIKEDRLCLLSATEPNAGFSVGNAMARNKYIYALADYALVISADVAKGGTWAGATEALEKISDVPVFVRMEGNISEGNRQLLKKGAKPFPESPWNSSLKELIAVATSDNQLIKTEEQGKGDTEVINIVDNKSDELPINTTEKVVYRPKNIYEAVLPFILQQLEEAKDEQTLAQCLNVQVGQIRVWLKQAVAEGKVIKHKNPVTYQVNRNETLLLSLEFIK